MEHILLYQTLPKLSFNELKTACQSNHWYTYLCNYDELWRIKVGNRYQQFSKPEHITWKDYYFNLAAKEFTRYIPVILIGILARDLGQVPIIPFKTTFENLLREIVLLVGQESYQRTNPKSLIIVFKINLNKYVSIFYEFLVNQFFISSHLYEHIYDQLDLEQIDWFHDQIQVEIYNCSWNREKLKCFYGKDEMRTYLHNPYDIELSKYPNVTNKILIDNSDLGDLI